MHYTYKTQGTCSTQIEFDINDNIISNIKYTNGCDGNLKMIAKLLEGKSVDYVNLKCKGHKCGLKNTSCADQLAQAVNKLYNQQ